ncbi:alpha/beta fold hydrolase [Chitinophaga sp. 22321]|uniref:Alpha/beta hydrolase n=1 Tax=Chitinophaga hostae TaxID=2831022 RepID=A0ABS5J843_9BACT|nr:alpha/beta hydrolase [Chitinophaga hostae]MBS0030737.1 alpha/beta hydrolase [Chitinophaga hostae]
MKKALVSAALLISSFISIKLMAQEHPPLKPDTAGYAPVNGLKLYYEIYGEGKPLVLIHGAYQTIPLCWGGMITELKKTRKVIALELPGHGHTVDIDRPFSYPAFSDDVAALLKYIGVNKADIMGFSIGGTTAMQLAVLHPDVVDRLVVLSAPYQYTGWLPVMRNMLQSLPPGFLDQTPYKAAHAGIYKDSTAFHKFTAKFIKFDTENFDLGDANIKNIKASVLFIMGDNDGVDIAHKAKMYQLCGGNVFSDISGHPTSQLAVLPNTGHVDVIMQTDKVLELAEHFLK